MRSTGGEHVVLDVREGRELDICQLKGALHIPMAEIPARVDDLPTNRRPSRAPHGWFPRGPMPHPANTLQGVKVGDGGAGPNASSRQP